MKESYTGTINQISGDLIQAFKDDLTNSDYSISDQYGGLLTNGLFSTWTGGDDIAPTGWSSTMCSVAKESTKIKSGQYSAKTTCTNSPGYVAIMYQAIHTTLGIAYWKGKTITFGGWVWCATSNMARLGIYDNVSTSLSDFHPGDSAWHYLTVTGTIAATATMVWLETYADLTATDFVTYYSGMKAVLGSTIASEIGSYTTSSSYVCDLCGFKFDSKKDLKTVKGSKLCIVCMDDDPKTDKHISGRSR